jgi:signal transduction histidine kinase
MPAKIPSSRPRKRRAAILVPAGAREGEDLKFLARGLVHDFNNLIGAILGNAALLKSVSEPGSDVESTAATIERAAERAAGLVRQLHHLMGAPPLTLGAVDLNESVREVANLLGPSLPPGVKVTPRLAEPPARITGDAAQLHRLLMNLALNARDAVAGGGEIVLETRWEGGQAVLTVSDDGPGIPAAQREKVFEPGYTTKAEGQGSGLGLAIVRRIVSLHGGSIEIAGAGGGGAVFLVRFPQSQNSRAGAL